MRIIYLILQEIFNFTIFNTSKNYSMSSLPFSSLHTVVIKTGLFSKIVCTYEFFSPNQTKADFDQTIKIYQQQQLMPRFDIFAHYIDLLGVYYGEMWLEGMSCWQWNDTQ